MDFLPEAINDYVERHCAPESELLQSLNRETYAKILMPRMLSGHMQGRVLSLLSRMIRPKRILEIGTYTGYSALCLAEGLVEGGCLDTIDINDELAAMVKRYMDQSEWGQKIHCHWGDARTVIPGIEGEFDLVFIDADKENYLTYYEMVLPRIPKGGWIIADNVLWSGKVLESEGKMDKDTRALHHFNTFVRNDKRVYPVLLPVRDGLMVLQKH